MDELGRERRLEFRSGSVESVDWWKRNLTKEVVGKPVDEVATTLAGDKEELEYASLRDQMSKALNRDAILLIAEKNRQLEMGHENHGVGMAFLDLDNFRRNAVTPGEGVLPRLVRDDRADGVIRQFSKLLTQISEEEYAKTGDLTWKGMDVGRLGGEEFAVVVADVEEKKFTLMLEVIRERVKKQLAIASGIADITHEQTVSIGGVVMRGGMSVAEGLTKADQALMLAKEQGKDRVVMVESRGEVSEEAETPRRLRREGERGSNREVRKQEIAEELKLKLDEARKLDGGEDVFIDELAREMEKLDQDQMRDALTKLLQRGAGLRVLNEVLSHTADNQETSKLVIMDIEKFKVINDTLGHDRGDEVLKGVADGINQIIEKSEWRDAMGVRWRPGGQFLLVVPHANKLTLEKGSVAEEVIRAVKEKFPEVNLHWAEMDVDGKKSVREVAMDLDVELERAKQDKLR